MNIILLVAIVIIAFLMQFLDAFIGMAYGEITAILLLVGFAPVEAILAVLITSAVMSLTAGILHHFAGNVDFSFEKKDLKIASVLAGFGVLGIILGAFLALNISEIFLKVYLGALIVVIGVIVLVNHKNKGKFSWKKIMGLGTLAAFNKGMTGGGYGPVLAGGQAASGVKGKEAVGITAIAEGTVSTVGVISYLLIGGTANINWSLIIALVTGGLIATPLAVYVVKELRTKKLNYFIGIGSLILGSAILIQLLL